MGSKSVYFMIHDWLGAESHHALMDMMTIHSYDLFNLFSKYPTFVSNQNTPNIFIALSFHWLISRETKGSSAQLSQIKASKPNSRAKTDRENGEAAKRGGVISALGKKAPSPAELNYPVS